MNRRLTGLALLAVLTALPALARVVSYAPYTDRVAQPGYHERTTRHFLLIERPEGNASPQAGQVVLYDTQGEEPRVVYPKQGVADLRNAVLYERKNGPAGAPPLILVQAGNFSTDSTWFSNDGGNTWKEIVALRNLGTRVESYGLDYGGPWTKGIGSAVRTGNDEWPFVLSGRGIWAISATGELKPLAGHSIGELLIGQNAAGTQFLYLVGQTTGLGYRVGILGLDGSTSIIATGWNNGTLPSGWIASNGSVYLLVNRWEGRFLYVYRDGELDFVRGPHGINPPDPEDGYQGTFGDPLAFFAVPTHDFNGAWMVQRSAGQPTRLARHTLAAGTEEMWSDVAAPEVEALIAGESGQTLLIQVHRERELQEEVIFVDPALAVWKVGDPAPRDYDELYLNEELDKGFVHVDVDRMAAGEPFVFNAGTFSVTDEGPVSPPVGGGGDVIQEWGVVRGSLRQHLILPGVARLPGAFNSNWRTDVTLYNPLDTPQAVEVRYAPLGEAIQPETVRKITITLQPYEIRFVADALQALFLIENGGGALHFLPAEAINVTGRTYSTKDGGTFGFGMQAIDAMNAASSRFPVTFSGAFPGDHFRTNILLTDTSGRGTEVGTSAYGVFGNTGPIRPTLSAPAGGILQYNGLGGSLGLHGSDQAGLVVQPTRGTAIATVVAIDNRTNDATWFPPDLSATTPRTIPVIGHVDGAHGSHFRSDIYLFNPQKTTQTVILEAKEWNTHFVDTRQFTLLPNEARLIEDALPTLFDMTGLARLRYWTDEPGNGVRVTSRTYTVEPDGATYGSLIPPLNNFQIASGGDTLEILVGGSGEGFRTNLGLVELSTQFFGDPRRVRISILGSGRAVLDSFEVTILSGKGSQMNDIFAARGIPVPAAALLTVELIDPGLLGAYATLTDNKTNDTTYLGAHLGGKEE